MSYKSLSSLPSNVKNHLPVYGQEIYLKAFNNSWKEYKNKNNSLDDKIREETAHSVAWSAVKTKYCKNEEGKWILIN